MYDKKSVKFLNFLQDSLSVARDELNLALKGGNTEPHLLLVTLWRYGFLTIEDLEKGFDWLSQRSWEEATPMALAT